MKHHYWQFKNVTLSDEIISKDTDTCTPVKAQVSYISTWRYWLAPNCSLFETIKAKKDQWKLHII